MILTALNRRRVALGMSHVSLARRSGVSLPTVHRILSGNHPNASWANVEAIAGALGMTIQLEPVDDPEDVRQKQAEKRATDLVRMVQGTSGLEGQAVSQEAIIRMIRRTTHELLAGSERKLWAD